MEGAAQAAVLEPAESEIGAAVGAIAVEQAVAAALVAKQHEVLAEQPHRLDRALALELLDERRRLPVLAHQLAGRRPRPDPGDQVVLLLAHHGAYPFPWSTLRNRSGLCFCCVRVLNYWSNGSTRR